MEAEKKRRRRSKDGLYFRGAYWWTILGGVRVSTGCRDREAARVWLAAREREAANPAHAAAKSTTIGDMIVAVLADRRVGRGKTGGVLAPESLEIYETKLGHVGRVMGPDTPLAYVTRERVLSYIETRFSEIAASKEDGDKLGPGNMRPGQHTIHKELTKLRFGLRLMKQEGKYEHDVDYVTGTRSFAVGYIPRKRNLSWEEIPRLLGGLMAWMPHQVSAGKLARARQLLVNGWTQSDAAAEMGVSLATFKRYVTMETPAPPPGVVSRTRHAAWYIATGARAKEARLAELRDHDLTNWVVYLRGTKTSEAPREIPIARSFRGLLAFALIGAPKTGPIFSPWTNENRTLKLACERAGIARVSPNDLRRTHSSLLRKAGVPLADLAPIMGHTTTRMLELVYGRTDVAAIARSLERYDPTDGEASVLRTCLRQLEGRDADEA